MSETWTPLVISASFAPNPVSVGLPTVLSVVVIDAQGGEREDLWHSGEVQAGEGSAWRLPRCGRSSMVSGTC